MIINSDKVLTTRFAIITDGTLLFNDSKSVSFQQFNQFTKFHSDENLFLYFYLQTNTTNLVSVYHNVPKNKNQTTRFREIPTGLLPLYSTANKGVLFVDLLIDPGAR